MLSIMFLCLFFFYKGIAVQRQQMRAEAEKTIFFKYLLRALPRFSRFTLRAYATLLFTDSDIITSINIYLHCRVY